ncbi:alpha/beta hydrolase family esterase [Tateyamaria sp.]|uniref:alpha/beta hydrolase family esterase n=1 Tax=Tateyamaria sp. TaxID=1929288 RepID=UPI00329AFFDB
MLRWPALILSALISLTSNAAQACGTESKCRIGDRHYYIAMPPGHDGKTPVPAAIFAHGLQGTALGSVRNPRLRAVAQQHGFALIGIKSRGDSWNTPGSPFDTRDGGRDELNYIDAVLADAAKRFPLQTDRIVMSGASAGGMLTWFLACERSAIFAGFVPMSGTFWDPLPRRCTKPVANIVHFHGDNDRTVPLQGRAVAGKQQGSVTEAFDLYTRFGNFRRPKQTQVGDMTCQTRANRRSNILNFCLYPGRHSFRSANLGIAWQMLRAAGQL